MRKELDEALCAKYPEIFRDRHGDMTTTAMCWGFSCGDGWYNIIDAACANIKNHLRNNEQLLELIAKHKKYQEMAWAGDWSFLENWQLDPKYIEQEKKRYLSEIPEWMSCVEKIPEVVATQVKEKYGTLRFYYNGGDEYIDGIVDMAESMSARTCETCGAPGKLRGGGWVYTACDEHTNPEDKE